MRPTVPRILSAGLLMALVAGLLPQPAAADSQADDVPLADCQAYFEFRGLADRRSEWEQTAAYRSMVRSGFGKVIDRYLTNAIKEAIPPDQRDFAEAADTKIDQAVDWLIANGAAIAVYRLREDEPNKLSKPDVVVIIPRADEAIGFLSGLGGNGRGPTFTPGDEGRYTLSVQGNEVHAVRVGQTLYFTPRMEATDAIRDRAMKQTASVSSHELFPADAGDAVSVGFGDLRNLQDRLKTIRVDDGGDDKPTVHEVLGVFGLESIASGQTVHTIDGETIRYRSSVSTNGQPNNVARTKLNGKMTLTDLPPLPSDVVGFSFARADLAKLIPAIEGNLYALFDKYGENGDDSREELDEGYNALVDELGFNPIRELLPALGSVIGLYDQPGGPPIALPTTLVVSVRDRATVRRCFGELIDRLKSEDGDDYDISRTEGKTYDRIRVQRLGTPLVVDYGLSDEWAIISLHPNAVESFFDESSKRWGASDDLLARNPKLGGEFLSMTYVDTAQTWQRGNLYLSMGLPFLGQFTGRPIAPPTLPLDQMTGSMFPNVTVVTGSDAGVDIDCTASAPAFLGGSSVTLGPVVPFVASLFVGINNNGSGRPAGRPAAEVESLDAEDQIEERQPQPAN